MTRSIAHRGPDGEGYHVEGGVALGHRRLSIIDLEGGGQPIENEDGSVVLVYNGEIYNYQSLMQELIAAGHTFRTRCDTEVVVHAWEEWGTKSVERFNGMFAFALYDRNQDVLFLARDRLGIKPLYIGETTDGRLLFGSELKALFVDPALPRDLDAFAVEDYFTYGYVPEPRTILRAVGKLPPGHTVRIERGRPVPKSHEYWDVPFADVGPLSDEDACEELIARLQAAVEQRMIAEVPLGAFLSGGVDSSAIVAMMSRVSRDPPKTCSIAFDEAEFDEAPHAARVAAHCQTDHRVERVSTNDFDLIDRLATLYDEPYADSSAIPTYRVCELARRGVTVALSGDGGDETLAGYRRYQRHLREESLRAKLPGGFRRPVFGLLGQVYPRMRWAPRLLRGRSTFQLLGRDALAGYGAISSLLNDDLKSRVYAPSFRRELDGYHGLEVMRGHAERAPTDDPLSLVQYLDLKTYLVGDILTKVDRASMAHGLEVRVPFLDHTLVEWTSGLRREHKLRDGEGKWLLKKSLEPNLPRENLYRRKQGFAVPLADWFRGPLRDRVTSVLSSPSITDSGVFDPESLQRLVGEHVARRQDHSAAIWSILMFDAFLRNLHDVPGSASRDPAQVGSS